MEMVEPLTNSTLEPAAWIFQQLGTPTEDARLKGTFLMSSIWPTITLISIYLAVCCIGPKFMETRKPWNLKCFIVVYNFCMVLVSLYMTIEMFSVSVLNPTFSSLACAPVDYSDDPYSRRLLSVLWIYYISKGAEFIETFVFVLRKKNSQISFLHVYHHSTMFFLWWATVKHCGGGSAYFSTMMNSFVHVIMYTYYMLSALGDSVRPYLWWKKYLTRLQLIQFWIVTFHTSCMLYIDCGYPRGYAWLLFVYMFTQKALFLNFYRKTYKPRSSTSVELQGLKKD